MDLAAARAVGWTDTCPRKAARKRSFRSFAPSNFESEAGAKLLDELCDRLTLLARCAPRQLLAAGALRFRRSYASRGPVDRLVRRNTHGPGQFPLRQLGTELSAAAVACIGEHVTELHLVLQQPIEFVQSDAPLRSKRNVFRHAGLGPSLLIRSPRLWQIEPQGDRHRNFVAGQSQRDEALTVRLFAERATARLHVLLHLAMRGAPPKAIQELAGHSTLAMTLRYMHLAPSVLREAIGLLDLGHPVGSDERTASGTQ